MNNSKPIIEPGKRGCRRALTPLLQRQEARSIADALTQNAVNGLQAKRKPVALDKELLRPRLRGFDLVLRSFSAHKSSMQDYRTDKFPVSKFSAPNCTFHCQQKRQQRCWESVESGNGGVVLDSSAKWGIFSLETTLEATDSDLRLQ